MQHQILRTLKIVNLSIIKTVNDPKYERSIHRSSFQLVIAECDFSNEFNTMAMGSKLKSADLHDDTKKLQQSKQELEMCIFQRYAL